MPTLTANGIELFYEESGSGPETIVFAHGLFTDHSMFAAQRAAFEPNYRVIVYDHRGQGDSPDPGWGFDMDTFCEDAAALIQALGAAPCHFVGISMGGNIGMRIAARKPELLLSLTLLNTRAINERLPRRLQHNFLARMAKLSNPAPFIGITLKELFGASTRNDPAKQALVQEWADKVRFRPKTAANSLLAVMNRSDFCGELGNIQCPVLVITGDEDVHCSPSECEALAASIGGAKLIVIPQCGHSTVLEQPEAVITAIQDLLAVVRVGETAELLRVTA
jgi:pimeloyl-ACP methyl ester carboxylesterase